MMCTATQRCRPRPGDLANLSDAPLDATPIMGCDGTNHALAVQQARHRNAPDRHPVCHRRSWRRKGEAVLDDPHRCVRCTWGSLRPHHVPRPISLTRTRTPRAGSQRVPQRSLVRGHGWSTRFLLTGGGALAGFYHGHRSTEALDFFSPPGADIDEASRALREAAREVGSHIETRQTCADFRRPRRGEPTRRASSTSSSTAPP